MYVLRNKENGNWVLILFNRKILEWDEKPQTNKPSPKLSGVERSGSWSGVKSL